MNRKLLLLFAACLILAVLAHAFFLYAWTEGRFMVGHNDGLQQMVTFKKLLYEQYTSGNFFYAYQFGLGGGIYSQLAFYFSTSIVFLIAAGVTYILELMGVVGTVDVVYWAKAAVFISVTRLMVILYITTLVFRYISGRWLPAFLGAAVYGLSVIYFRHATYWEFFADAMLWVPLLVYGVEKIIREARPGWFIFAVAVTMFDNFYFAYINLIFITMYMLARLSIRLDNNEISLRRKVKLFVIAGLVGAGMSAVSFIPAVYSFFHNHRPDYAFPIEIVDFSDNILFTSRYVIVPALFILFIFTYSFYRYAMFRLFGVLSILFILLHFSPLAASAFNGFSAPQYRWEYVLSFTIGGAVCAGLQHLHRVSKKAVLLASAIVIVSYIAFLLRDEKMEWISLPGMCVFLLMGLTLVLAASFVWSSKIIWYYFICAVTIFNLLVSSNASQYVISEMTGVNKVTEQFLHSDQYNGEEHRELLGKIKKQDSSPFFRIDWKVGYLNNTPIVQDFNGMSVYSSILNENLLYFYLNDLNIDMGRESVSRYSTLSNRANLYSILQGKYVIKKKKDTGNVPYGFSEAASTEHYIAYENTNLLPFVRTTDTIFSERDLADANVLEKEHAMLEGVIATRAETPGAEVKDVPDIVKKTRLTEVGSTYDDGKLTVTKKEGGIDLTLDEPVSGDGDFYVSFHLESLAKRKGFAVKVNDYRTTRKHNQSIYKTYVDDLVIRVPKANKLKIRLPKGNYVLTDLALYEEDYQLLEREKKEAPEEPDFEWSGNKLTIRYDNKQGDRFMMLPIPYERGWQVQVNDEAQPIEKVNYAFVGFPAQEGFNKIQLVYYPPFFKLSLLVTAVCILLAILLSKRRIFNPNL
ncbi:YfhO family protein [Thalassobacillus devorans]|uniref:YfhO family protein n=1 Tax=Thalassobacillus devorans TaxID=279813 RepID=UPI00048DBDC8|nr:YfhO family protein [Thalassobacillus devorans]